MCAHTNVSISVKNRNNEILKPYECLSSHLILHIIVILSTPNRAIRRKWETSNASTSNAMFFLHRCHLKFIYTLKWETKNGNFWLWKRWRMVLVWVFKIYAFTTYDRVGTWAHQTCIHVHTILNAHHIAWHTIDCLLMANNNVKK